MSTPPHYRREELPLLHGHMEQNGFATLVTMGAEGLTASHIPMLIDRQAGRYGTIRGHFSKANPQWRDAGSETPALAIFPGPNAYISPGWYASKRAHGKVVPTWNYTAVHATGYLEVTEDEDTLARIVADLTDRHERNFAAPWRTTDAPADFIRRNIKGIVGFEIAITKLEGKWKMSQNKAEADRAGAIEGLTADGSQAGLDVAAIMRGLEDG